MDVTYRFLNLMLALWVPACGPSLKSDQPIGKRSAVGDGDPFVVRSNNKSINRSRITPKTNSNNSTHHSITASLPDSKPISPNPDSNQTIPDVGKIQTRCLLVEDRGHIIAHPSLYAPGLNRPVEHNHLSFYEPALAAYLVNHHDLITKSACLSYRKRVIQRYYSFNLSMTSGEVLRNAIPNEQCIKYQFARIPHSNLFFGLIKEDRRPDCISKPIFCPCSTRSRRCLNCEQQVEQRECECPCECPLTTKVRTLPDFERSEEVGDQRDNSGSKRGWIFKAPFSLIDNQTSESYLSDQETTTTTMPPSSQYPACSNLMDSDYSSMLSPNLDFRLSFRSISPICRLDTDRYGSLTPSSPTTATSNSDQLLPTKSDFDSSSSENIVRCTRRGRISCSAAVGCEWCMLASNLQELEHPFCSSMSVCPNGIMNAFPSFTNPSSSFDGWPVRNPMSNLLWHRDTDSSYKEPLHRLIELMTRKVRLFQNHGRLEPYPPGVDDKLGTVRQQQQELLLQPQDRSALMMNIPLGPVASAILGSLTIFALVIYFIHHQKRLRRENLAATRLSHQLQSNTETFHEAQINTDTNGNNVVCANDKCNHHFGNSDGCPPPAPGAGTMGLSTETAPVTYDLGAPSDTDSASHDGLESDLKNPLLPQQCTVELVKRDQNSFTHSNSTGQPKLAQLLEQNIESGIEDELPSEPSKLLVQCGSNMVPIPPNPYHMGLLDSPSCSNQRSTLGLTRGTSSSIRNRELDSAIGSDCATAASVSSSSASKLGPTSHHHHHHMDEVDSSSECVAERPLGICIGTIIMGPDKPNSSDKASFC